MRILLVFFSFAVVQSGCGDRSHLSPGYGRALRVSLRSQVDMTAGTRPAVAQGLDPEEAAIVLETYRKTLSPHKDGSGQNRSPVIILPAPGAGGLPTVPSSVNP